MGLRYDPVAAYEQLMNHIGHKIVVVAYGEADDPENISIECETCYETLVSFERPLNAEL